MNITDQCYEKSIKLLKANSTKHGILACAPSRVAEERNYLSIFGRDASICSLGMVLSGDKELIRYARAGLLTLAKYQADNGAIPFYVKPEKRKSSFWYTVSIDSTLWWLIAIKFYDQHAKDRAKLSKKLKVEIDKALAFLSARENPVFSLLEQNEASDWADIMPRSGYVLNANALWYYVKNLYKIKTAERTKEVFNYLFDQSSSIPARIKKENSRLARIISYVPRKKIFSNYLSFVNFAQYPKSEDIDIFSNLLAIINGLSNKKQAKNFLRFAMRNKISQASSTRATLKPINKTSLLWREYMKRHNQNFPDKYHNGGCWPFIGGFYVIALKMVGFEKEAEEELEKLAKTNKKGNWSFNEWFHGKTGRAMGKADQSWNAGMYVVAYELVIRNKKL